MVRKEFSIFPMFSVNLSKIENKEIGIKPKEDLLLKIKENRVDIYLEGCFEGYFNLKNKLYVSCEGIETLIFDETKSKLIDYKFPPRDIEKFKIEIVKKYGELKITNLGKNLIKGFID